jgi:two-component system sensor histidine kinase DesK
MRLLPPHKDIGWTPYVWLIYLGFFLLNPFLQHASRAMWTAMGLGIVLFLPLYFAGYWLRDRRNLWIVAAIALLGFAFAPFNPGASVFIVYASSFAAFTGSAAFAAALILLLTASVGVETWLLHLHPVFWINGTVTSIAIGAVNIHFAQRSYANRQLRMAHEEIQHLARIAERERIARDMHDVLGHTLSLVILKSELASKLVEHDPQRAAGEIRDIEQAAREALAEVRNTISGYHAGTLEEELLRARATLDTAGIALEYEASSLSLPPAQEMVLALALREAITNIVRHAHAKHCRLRLEQTHNTCLLEIADDGRGGTSEEGNGMRGMRARIEALEGKILRVTNTGTRLTIELPLGKGVRA